ncbi:MAG: hypothetical protein RR978_03960 [Oscillospiraceae bacterium]
MQISPKAHKGKNQYTVTYDAQPLQGAWARTAALGGKSRSPPEECMRSACIWAFVGGASYCAWVRCLANSDTFPVTISVTKG